MMDKIFLPKFGYDREGGMSLMRKGEVTKKLWRYPMWNIFTPTHNTHLSSPEYISFHTTSLITGKPTQAKSKF